MILTKSQDITDRIVRKFTYNIYNTLINILDLEHDETDGSYGTFFDPIHYFIDLDIQDEYSPNYQYIVFKFKEVEKSDEKIEFLKLKCSTDEIKIEKSENITKEKLKELMLDNDEIFKVAMNIQDYLE